MYDIGLTLGKFAPFHRGHQFLMDTALAEVRHLIVIVYQAHCTTDLPLSVRAGWIRFLYPQVEVLEAPDGPEAVGYSRDIQVLHEKFLIEFLAGRRIDAFYSSEQYGAHVSRALGCTDRRIDEARARMPVSGTMLRAHPALRQQWLHPLVRADLVRRIVLLGGPSTGKTSLAAKLALQMEEPWCPEYGRDYWFAHQVDHRLSMEDLETIACGQATLESRLAYGATAFLPVDTCPLTTWAYAMRYFGHASEALERTLELYLAFPRDYWLCDVDLPFEDTPDRSGPGSREEHQAITVRELERRGMSFLTVSGSLEKRAAFILQFMRGIQ